MWRVVLLSWWLLGTLALCCPPDCRCFTDNDGYKVANCSRSGLLSGGLFPTIDVLNFKNQLRGSQTKLEARIFRNFRGLQVLNLQNSSISHLPNDVFLGIGRVFSIDLSFNKIKHLNGVVFKPLHNLKDLNLRGNSLSMSPLEVIVSDTLEQLDMGYCNINNLPLHTFSSVPSLRYLILDGNSIQTIEYNVLPKGLTYINLASNHIIEPPINVFNSLRYLFRLDISHNPINCSCALLAFQDSLSGRAGLLENGVTCANPPHLVGRSIDSVNENQLCRDDYAKKDGSNSLMHSRRSRYHRLYDYQSDEPLMGDESYSARHAAEVMFTNDETNQMGTHMEARLRSHAAEIPSETPKNNQLEIMDETTVSEKDDPSSENEPLQNLAVSHRTPSPEEEESRGISPDDLTKSSDSPEPETPTAEYLPHTEESYSGNDNIINLSSSDPLGGTSDHSNNLHALGVGYNNVTEPSTPQESNEPKWTPESDAELLSSTLGDEPSSNLELAEDTTTEVSPDTSSKSFTLPTSATDSADYSYDSQHLDYTVDNVTSSEFEDEPLPPMSSSTVSTDDELEGSGSPETDTTSESSSTAIGFMEDQETGTEPSLQTVSDDLDASSTTTYDGLLSSSESSSVEPTTDSSTETPTEPSEPSSSESPSTEPSTEASSSEPSTEPGITGLVVSSTEGSSTPEETSEPTTETSTEPTTETSTEPTTETSSEPTTETSSEPSTLLPVDISSGASSTELSSIAEPSSSSQNPFWWDSDEDISPSSSAATPVSTGTSEGSSRKSKMMEFTTEGAVDNEIEVDDNMMVAGEKNGKITVGSSQSTEKNYLTTGITFILIGILIAVVMILLTIIMCRKKKVTKKVRLPADPEAANGTELQDMLLPKPPENGIKVLPKAYTNGTTPVSNGKPKEPEDQEETVPVLAPEPEPEPWDDKPEPIEAVTARLTMLARPQTPIFIQKSLT